MDSVCNTFLIPGLGPFVFKCAIVRPVLKKPSLDPSQPKNCRHISKLSKTLEKVVAEQLTFSGTYLNSMKTFSEIFSKIILQKLLSFRSPDIMM